MKAATFTASTFLGRVSLAGDNWSEEFDAELLPARIKFYERMEKDFGHRTTGYRSVLSALKGLTQT